MGEILVVQHTGACIYGMLLLDEFYDGVKRNSR